MKTIHNDKEAKKAKRKANRIARKAISAEVTNTPEIKVGMVVTYNDPAGKESGWMRVNSATKYTVNLGPVFGNGRTIYHKAVPKSLVTEDEAVWYEAWTKTEAYQCM